MDRRDFGAMLAAAADIVTTVAPAGTPVTNAVTISRDNRIAFGGPRALTTLVAAGAAGRRARLTWALRALSCRREPLRLPADAAAVNNDFKRTIAVLSADAGLAVKLSHGAHAAGMLSAEIATVAEPALQAHGLAPVVLASDTGEEKAWLAVEYCRAAAFPDTEAYVAALRTDLMPRLFAAWADRGPRPDSAAALVARVRDGLPVVPELATAFARLEALLAASGDFAFPVVATHGDLQPRHLMLAADGRLRLIDWDVAAPRPWVADLLRLAPPAALHGPDWAGGETLLAPAFRPVFEDGLAWSAGFGGDVPGPGGRALLVLGVLLERTIEIAAVRGFPFSGQPLTAGALKVMGLLA